MGTRSKQMVIQQAPAQKQLAVHQTVFGGRYRLERALSANANGSVWRALDLELGVPRALKFLDERLMADPAELDNLKAEAIRCQELTHQNIVRIYDFHRDVHHAAISMELIDGPNLRDYARRRERRWFEVEEIRFWVTELCRALHYAHSYAGIIHRDLKPKNLLLTRQGHLKVADFGISTAINETLSRLRRGDKIEIAGTPDYMSPQQAMGKPPDISDDIYNLGATLHELLTGHPPFEGDDLYQQLMHSPAPTITQSRRAYGVEGLPTPANWQEIIQSCLAKEPSGRPTTVRAIAGQLGLELLTLSIREPAIPEDFRDFDNVTINVAAMMPSASTVGVESTLSQRAAERRARVSRSYPRWSRSAKNLGLLAWVGLVIAGAAFLFFRGGKTPPAQVEKPAAQPPPVLPAVAAPRNATPSPREIAETENVLGEIERHVAEGHWEEARQRINPLLAQFPNHAEVRFAEAKILHGEGDRELALRALDDVLDEHPSHAEACALKAHWLAERKQPERVAPAAEWALAQKGNDLKADLHLALASAQRATGYLDEALRSFERARELEPRRSDTLFALGQAKEEAGDLATAIEHYSGAVALDPASKEMRLARGHAAFRAAAKQEDEEAARGLFITAAEDFTSVIDQSSGKDDEQLWQTVFFRLQTYAALKDWVKVREACGRLIARGPQWEKHVKGYRESAEAALGPETPAPAPVPPPDAAPPQAPPVVVPPVVAAKAPEPEPAPPPKPQPAPKVERGPLAEANDYLQEREYTKAIAVFGVALGREPGNRAANLGRGWAYKRRSAVKTAGPAANVRDLRASIADFERVINSAKELATSDVYLAKANSHFRLGEYKEAASTCDKGLRRFPHDRKLRYYREHEIPDAVAAKKKRDAKKRDAEPGFLERLFNRGKSSKGR